MPFLEFDAEESASYWADALDDPLVVETLVLGDRISHALDQLVGMAMSAPSNPSENRRLAELARRAEALAHDFLGEHRAAK